MPKLSHEEQVAFLNERKIGLRLGCTREDGSPIVVPISFLHQDGEIYFTPRAKSEWFGCLRRDPRVALCIDELPQPMRKMIIEGEAELVHDLGEDDEWRDLFLTMMKRYTSDEEAEAYVTSTDDQQRGLYKVTLAKCRIKSWRTPIGDEDPTGIWHQRYYADGTKLANH